MSINQPAQPAQNNKQQINLQADPKDLKGRYANAFSVTSQEREVVIDFLSHVNANGLNQAQLVSRVFLNRFTAQDLVTVMQQALAQWEKIRYEGGVALPASSEPSDAK